MQFQISWTERRERDDEAQEQPLRTNEKPSRPRKDQTRRYDSVERLSISDEERGGANRLFESQTSKRSSPTSRQNEWRKDLVLDGERVKKGPRKERTDDDISRAEIKFSRRRTHFVWEGTRDLLCGEGKVGGTG